MRFRTTVIYTITLIVVAVDCRSIGTSESNVTKRETERQDDPFPDWVPFKNKHGEELGEFLQVETVIKKPKKRLALPMNFILQSVAEPEDYFEKGLGESDGEEYYEKREWSDGDRPGKAADTRQPLSLADLSDIEGVVGIITRQNPLRTSTNKPKRKDINKKTKTKKIIDYTDDEDEADKRKTNEDNIENERKKALILESVDELKERHAAEQKIMSEKVKEEAMHTEERDRDNIQREIFDKYSQKSKGRPIDYEEYDGKYEDKYKITPLRKYMSTTWPTTESTNSPSTASTTPRAAQTGRMSVFRNPSIYMIYDEETSTETTTQTSVIAPSVTTSTEGVPFTKFHSKITMPPTKVDLHKSERISLVPQDNELREGEPTMFFPKKTKRKNSQKAMIEKTISSDSLISPSNYNNATLDVLTNMTDAIWAGSETAPSETASAIDNTGPTAGSGPLGSELSDSGSLESEIALTGAAAGSSETSASAPEESAAPPSLAVDAQPAPSEHRAEKKGDKGYEREKGGETEHHSEHRSQHGESGTKAYEGVHKNTKTEKGHHDKEDHLGKYHDHGGVDKEHHDQKEHYGSHHHEEHGKKHAKYEESGKHSKGHSTKGSHDIHKKEEYEKNVEFFEEEGDSAEEEKHGAHHEDRGHQKGGQYKKADHDASHHDRAKGDSGHFSKNGHVQEHRGHSAAAGQDAHGKHGANKFMEGDKKSGKKWIYHHGFPAKNANLVVIDRRSDQLYHGQQYYG